MIFIHENNHTRHEYSTERGAVAEYFRNSDGSWRLAGWHWDGELDGLEHAEVMLEGYLTVFGDRNHARASNAVPWRASWHRA